MPADYSSIIWEIRESVARITLNQPPLNIMDIPTIGEMHRAVAAVHSASDLKVLVIDLRGGAFSGGVSIRDHTSDKVGEMIEKFHAIFRFLNSICRPQRGAGGQNGFGKRL